MFRFPRDNPLLRLLLRRALRPNQIAAFLVYTAVYCLVAQGPLLAIQHMGIGMGWSRWLGLLAGWVLGEFLICWMAADSVFPAWGRLKKEGTLEAVYLSRVTAREVHDAFLWSTSLLVILAGILSLALPYSVGAWYTDGLASYLIQNPDRVWAVVVPCVLALAHVLAGIMTAAIALRRLASRPYDRPESAWFMTLCEAAVYGGIPLLAAYYFWAAMGPRDLLIILPAVVTFGWSIRCITLRRSSTEFDARFSTSSWLPQ